MSISVSKGYDYTRRRDITSPIFSKKNRQYSVGNSQGWKIRQSVDSMPIPKMQPSLVESKIHFELTNDISLAIPSKLEGLIEELEHSKYILNLEKGWDGELADPYSAETLKSAISFLCRYLMWFTHNNISKFHLPKIYHGPDGSIDLLWCNDVFSLLINIDREGNNGQFSGGVFETENSQSSQGNFKVNCRTFEFLPSPTVS